MDVDKLLLAMNIYQRKYGGALVEISVLFVNVTAALKEAAQQPLLPGVCPYCLGTKRGKMNGIEVGCIFCRTTVTLKKRERCDESKISSTNS